MEILFLCLLSVSTFLGSAIKDVEIVNARAGSDVNNIDSVLKGYNPLFGNLLSEGTSDPGTKNQIFAARDERGDIYDFIDRNNDKKCRIGTEQSTFRSQQEYERKKSGTYSKDQEMSNSFSAGGIIPFETFLLNFKFSLTQESKHTVDSSFEEEMKFFRETEGEIYMNEMRCQLFRVSIGEFQAPVFTYSFENAIQKLYEAALNPNTKSSRDTTLHFLDEFGTHYMKTAWLGATLTAESRWASNAGSEDERKARRECVGDSFKVGQESSAGVDGIGNMSSKSDFKRETKKCKADSENSAYFNSNTLRETKVVSHGSDPYQDPGKWVESVGKDPVPIDFKLQRISNLFKQEWVEYLDVNGTLLAEYFDKTLLEYCETVLGKPCELVTGCQVTSVCKDDETYCENVDTELGFKCTPYSDFLITGGLGSATSAEIWSPGKKNQVCELPKLDSTRIAHSQNGLHVCGGVKGKTCSKLQNGYWSRTHSLPEKRVHHVSWETNNGVILMGGVSSPSTSTVIKGSEVKKGFGLKYDLSYACGISQGDTIVIAGGAGSDYNSAISRVSLYGLDGFIKELPSLIARRRSPGCASFFNQDLKKVLLVAGGFDGKNYLDSTEQSINFGNWEFSGRLPSKVWGSRGCTYRNDAFMMGGLESDNKGDTSIFKFDKIAGIWEKIGSMKNARGLHSISLVSTQEVKNKKYCV